MSREFFDEDGNALTDVSVMIHHYDRSLKYSGSGLEFIKFGTGVPAHSTLDEPPEYVEGKVLFRDQERSIWYHVSDFTGETFYHKKTGKRVLITEPGEIGEEYTSDVPLVPFPMFDNESGEWVVNEEELKAYHVWSAKTKKAELLETTRTALFPLDIAHEEGWAGKDVISKRKALRKFAWEVNNVDPEQAPQIEWPKLET